VKIKKAGKPALLLRRGGSNSRPTGYEPVELPLLYFAIWRAKIILLPLPAKEKTLSMENVYF
jgi:hypothetical protein